MLPVVDVVGNLALALATLGLAAVGAWLAHNYRRRMRLALAEARRTAYAELWQVTGVGAPTRLDTAGPDGCLTRAERQDLYQSMTSWYYKNGNGMLLEVTTREVYLNAKHNLVCTIRKFKPPDVWDTIRKDLPDLDEEQVRGVLSIRQLSLLRTQLKSDLGIFGETYTHNLTQHDRRFLEKAGVDLGSKPWKQAAKSSPRSQQVLRTTDSDQPLVVPRW
jgi:hypothetical protein